MRFINIFNLKVFATLFLLGICLAQYFYFYKNYLLLFLIIFILITLILFYKYFFNYNWFNTLLPRLLLILLAVGLGFWWICWHIDEFKKQSYLTYSHTSKNYSSLIQGTVVSLPFIKNNILYFDFFMQDISKIRLKWPNPPANIVDTINPGDYWQVYVKLKKPRNFFTPGSFDVEKQMFISRISALGKVINSPNNRLKISYKNRTFNLGCFINRLRKSIINKLNNLSKKDLILAIGLGVKDNILPLDLLAFQNTGTSHLLAISGLHISFLVGLSFWIIAWLWKRFVFVELLERVPAPIVAGGFSMGIAIFYASLAGLGIATQRALIMLGIYLCAIIFRKIIAVEQIYFLSLISILILDPFVSLSSGFWLSFLAVGILLYKKPTKLLSINWLMFVGLLPISGLFFGKIAFNSVIANLIAIPWFNFLILPWILLGLLLFGVFNLKYGVYSLVFANLNLEWLVLVLHKLQDLPYGMIHISMPTSSIFLVSIIGSLWLLAPKGILNRGVAIICFLPLFFNKKVLPEYGDAVVSVLDVGQGLAVVIKLKNHILLYDTGANNKVVANYLKYFNYSNIDYAIISHTDFDHIGGLEEIVKQNTVKNLVTNVNYKIVNLTASLCQANYSWNLDGVNFEFLYPKKDNQPELVSRNDNSCVLKMSTINHSMLFTGDISKTAEQVLINTFAIYGNKLKSDIMLIPHHGSKHSSSLAFIEAINPKYAVVSAGYMNNYGHPKSKVLHKYLTKKIQILNTITDGTIDFIIKPETIEYNCYKIAYEKFWNY